MYLRNNVFIKNFYIYEKLRDIIIIFIMIKYFILFTTRILIDYNLIIKPLKN